MKKFISLLLVSALISCSTLSFGGSTKPSIVAQIDLVEVENDKIRVVINPDKFLADEVVFRIPRTVPGTYSEDNYGRLVEDFIALDYKGKELPVTKIDLNTWTIHGSKLLDKIKYSVNDSYDTDGELGIFSPAGINIEKGKNFMLNNYAVVGYFEGLEESQYQLEIERPKNLVAGSSLRLLKTIRSGEMDRDIFTAERYFDVTDNPIMYSTPDTIIFEVEEMEVLISLYSPNKVFSVQTVQPGIERMIRAQKKFLGEIDNTSKYAVLLYLSDPEKKDAQGSGALEHHNSTVVVFPESMSSEELENSMIDVVSHEFFHILTPLNIHSEQIHYFDYNDPEMSEHLWMYEGVTEYFAHLFQVNQGLIDEDEFLGRISDKIRTSRQYDDTVPFTVMSKNILQPEYNSTFYNVYMKGALIAMALDIRLRELSSGKEGLLDAMKELSKKYGKTDPFEDGKLFGEIVAITHPEIEDFFNTYVNGSTPIPYDSFLNEVGVELEKVELPTGYLVDGQDPYIDLNPETSEIFFRRNITLNSFLKNHLKAKAGDVITAINGRIVTPKNVGEHIRQSFEWKEGEKIIVRVHRDGKEIQLESEAVAPTTSSWLLVRKDLQQGDPAFHLREAWLKG